MNPQLCGRFYESSAHNTDIFLHRSSMILWTFLLFSRTLHLYQRHLCLYKEIVQKILTYFLLCGLSGRPIEDRALLPRLDKSLRSGPRNRSKKESGRSTSLWSLCEAQFLSITRNWVSLGDRKMSNRNISKLFIQYVAFCSPLVKCTLNTFKFCRLGWWVVHFFSMVKPDFTATDLLLSVHLTWVIGVQGSHGELRSSFSLDVTLP